MPETALVARDPGPVGGPLCRGLAEQGIDVAVAFDQDVDAAEACAEAAREAGARAVVLGGRVGDPMVARKLVQRTERELAPPEALVVLPRSVRVGEPDEDPDDPAASLLRLDAGGVEPVLQADLKGPLALLQAAAEPMLDAGNGRAVLCGPAARRRAGPAGTAAAAAARGLEAVAERAAEALAPQVTVNALVPGPLPPSTGEDREAGPAREVADAILRALTGPGRLTGQTLRVPAGEGGVPEAAPDEGDPDALPGIEQRVQPPDPEDRIDVGEPGLDEDPAPG